MIDLETNCEKCLLISNNFYLSTFRTPQDDYMLPGVHGGIEHTYIHGGGVVVLYYVRLSVRTLLYFVHAVLFCRTPLCFCLAFL